MISLVVLVLVAIASADDLPWFQYDGDSHYEFGLALGEHFQATIQARVAQTTSLNSILLPFAHTSQGNEIYNTYLATHNATFPEYVQEVLGMAHGSFVPFETLFILNIIEEFTSSMNKAALSNGLFQPATLHCSDVILHTKDVCLVAHNEDSGAASVNRTAIVTARIKDNGWFTAYTYLGDLPTGAFGANGNGIAFSLNYVEPLDIDGNGLGRGFISRDLLTAKNFSHAIDIATQPHQATGHNIQACIALLMDIVRKQVVNIEVASFNRSVVTTFTANSQPFFHTNQYQTLLIRQPAFSSSYHRLRRYKHLPLPTTIQSILNVLGDQGDTSYPIYHDAISHAKGELSNWTLITVVFDVYNSKLYFLQPHINPKLAQVIMVLDLDNVKELQILRSIQERTEATKRLLQL
ncbi:cysteine protease family C45 [Thraustotheca clavata]|uniref:Cysteine protease family C45 n=1 Tax=Thraustotheca clavata TaxID=74557 RepID=A0A1W0A3X3_9STRA|nr:cysteine protease family C45 [Thraustotheca clavata]